MLKGENGACAYKKDIATWAKQDGHDAIHDTVHEMAKDEARHGKALEAVLKRYFDVELDSADDVSEDPVVCNCFNVTESTVKAAVIAGADSVEKIGEVTKAGTGCGGCKKKLESYL